MDWESEKTLTGRFGRIIKRYGDQTALIYQDTIMTYRELYRASCRVAHALIDQGVERQSLVAVWMSNSIEFVVVDMALILLGETRIPLNDMLSIHEVSHILHDSKAQLLIAGEQFVQQIEERRGNFPELSSVIGMVPQHVCGPGVIAWESWLAGKVDTDIEVQSEARDIALIVYTGGTTGAPKGVMHSQENLVANVLSHIIELEMQDNERILLTSPLPHSAGMVMTAGLAKGAVHVIERKFDPDQVLMRIATERVTLTFMVPTMIYRVIDRIEERLREGVTYDLQSLRTILYGAAPITQSRLSRALEVFGPVFTQLYGQTEAPNFIARLRKEDHQVTGPHAYRLRSCGQAVLMADLRVLSETGEIQQPGLPGEVVVHTPYNMVGYLHLPQQTEQTLRDGWLHTGDIGYLDEDGYLFLLDRKKDVIISGGMNVYSSEIESVLQKHPDILLATVIGVPDEDWGEAVFAWIVARPGMTITEQDVAEHCNDHLSKYKRPKQVVIVEQLPLTPYGKVDKKKLREQFWKDEQRSIH
ncbi:MAG: AMP-binding protein [Acidibacillus sp.]|nr:AMP-binding protein [Acidibacillus sp.]